ncbi:restriction endonuclease subunit S, partial [Staphylococcus sp. EG-SA-29]|uniref:restriction endonuclease subunit S n=1 Tax=Staphylococcus sp. EG-SA-29 TaxID=2767500 RepID=UPI0019806737
EQGMSPTAAEDDLDDDQWAVLSLSAVNRGAFVPSAIKPVGAEVMVPPSLELSDGDLLMTRSNTRERVGDVAIVSGVRPKTFMSDLIYRITPDERVLLSDYASLLLRGRSVRDQIESVARGSSGTMPKLAQSHIKGLRVRIPALEIQQATIE